MRRKVTAKERRIDHNAANHTANAEADDGEVMAGSALAATLPAVHPLAAVGVLVFLPDRLDGTEEVFLFSEIIVGRVENGAAEALGGEVESLAKITHRRIHSPIAFPRC